MGVIDGLLSLIFGNGRNVIRETVEVFQENAEAAGRRASAMQNAALGQFGAEFQTPQRGRFDRVMDGINRLPRPALALGTLGLFVAAMVDPVWFAARMQGIALVPEPLWWLLGAIVSFYFGARHQAKGQAFHEQITRTLAKVPKVVGNLEALDALERGARSPGIGQTGHDVVQGGDALRPEVNPALEAWQRSADQGR
ncbi:holin family protein [Rhodobacteraceae bacterium D3-12]|nr:holin family protein [Rhodobacteraceae bacterium D3-12]